MIADPVAVSARLVPAPIPVDVGGRAAAVLEPLTADNVDDAVAEHLTRWRNAARETFLTQFEASPARTRDWLGNTVLRDSRRLLFIIRDAAGPLGTIGFLHLTAESAELDHLIRGERRGAPALMRRCEAALIQWLFDSFALRRIEAVVLAGNFPALQLHQSIGFQIVSRTHLRRIARDGEVALIETNEPDAGGLAKLRLFLAREDFEP